MTLIDNEQLKEIYRDDNLEPLDRTNKFVQRYSEASKEMCIPVSVLKEMLDLLYRLRREDIEPSFVFRGPGGTRKIGVVEIKAILELDNGNRV